MIIIINRRRLLEISDKRRRWRGWWSPLVYTERTVLYVLYVSACARVQMYTYVCALIKERYFRGRDRVWGICIHIYGRTKRQIRAAVFIVFTLATVVLTDEWCIRSGYIRRTAKHRSKPKLSVVSVETTRSLDRPRWRRRRHRQRKYFPY